MQPGSIYAITDPQLLPGAALFSGVTAALRGGLRTLQYRDKDASLAERRSRAKQLLQICQDYGATLLINDDAHLAAEIGAHGVHLGQGDAPLQEARALMGADAIIGVTCHASLTLARLAAAEGADYLAFGRFFTSNTKPGAPPAPVEVLRRARDELSLPVVAIGGISLDNMDKLIGSGANSLAMCHSIFAASDIEATTRAFLARYHSLVQQQHGNEYE